MKNKYRIDGESVYIQVSTTFIGTVEFIIDVADLPLVDAFPNSWYIKSRKDNYVEGSLPRNGGKQKQVSLHRFLFSDEILGKEVDHINHNKMDNRRSNLRIVTLMQNSQNRNRANSTSKSGVLGVSWQEKYQTWRAQLCHNRKVMHLGSFKDIEKAKEAVTEARKRLLPFSQEAMNA